MCLITNVIVLLGGVYSRYLLNVSPIWLEELARYTLIACVMIMSGCLINTNEHMRLNFIDKLQSSKLRYIANIYRNIVVTALSAYLCIVSFEYVIIVKNFSTIGLDLSMSIPLLTLPIGYLFVCLFSMANVVVTTLEKDA